jgi:ferredoxin
MASKRGSARARQTTVGIHSDPTLLAEIRRYGPFDTSGCYQCGSCTISCDRVSGSASFPRKSMRYALLGLREPLLGSLDPWVCRECGDCSLACPRQTEPRISMITLRRFLNAQYDGTGIVAKLQQSRAWYLGSLIGAALLALLLILGFHLWFLGTSFSRFATTPVGLGHMFPLITYYTLAVMLVPWALLFSRVHRIWRLTMWGEEKTRPPLSAYLIGAWTFIYESMSRSMMRNKCPRRSGWLGHMLLATGTVIMLIISIFALKWFQTDNIYPVYYPQRWLGYLAAALILFGLADMLVRRLRGSEETGPKLNQELDKDRRFERMVFPVLLFLTVISGLSAHVLRYQGLVLACQYVYALHVIIATPMLLVEMSFGNWSHMVYRPLALYFLAVRERAERQAAAGEVASHAV